MSSNGSTVRMQSHMYYICLTFLNCVISERELGPGSYCILGQIYFVYLAAAVLPQTIQENLLCNFQTSRCGNICMNSSLWIESLLQQNNIFGEAVLKYKTNCQLPSVKIWTLFRFEGHGIKTPNMSRKKHIFLSLVVREGRGRILLITFPLRFIA